MAVVLFLLFASCRQWIPKEINCGLMYVENHINSAFHISNLLVRHVLFCKQVRVYFKFFLSID